MSRTLLLIVASLCVASCFVVQTASLRSGEPPH